MANSGGSSQATSKSSGSGAAAGAGYAQAGLGTMGAIMDFIRSGQAMKNNEKLFQLQKYIDSRNREDALKQQAIQNQQNQQQINSSINATNANISNNAQQLQMAKNKQLADNLKSAFSANPALFNGVRSLFTGQ